MISEWTRLPCELVGSLSLEKLRKRWKTQKTWQTDSRLIPKILPMVFMA